MTLLLHIGQYLDSFSEDWPQANGAALPSMAESMWLGVHPQSTPCPTLTLDGFTCMEGRLPSFK